MSEVNVPLVDGALLSETMSAPESVEKAGLDRPQFENVDVGDFARIMSLAQQEHVPLEASAASIRSYETMEAVESVITGPRRGPESVAIQKVRSLETVEGHFEASQRAPSETSE